MRWNLFSTKETEINQLQTQLSGLVKINEELQAKVSTIVDTSELQADRDNLFNELQGLKELQNNHETVVTSLKTEHETNVATLTKEFEGKLTEKETVITDLNKQIVALNETHKKDLEQVTSTKDLEVVATAANIVAEQCVVVPIEDLSVTDETTHVTEAAKTLRGSALSEFYLKNKELYIKR